MKPKHVHLLATLLPTTLIYIYKGDELRNIFQPEAIMRARQSIWDAERNEIISSADLYLDQSGEI
jgi:hypothetical protein